MSKLLILLEFFSFMKERKKWFLAPIIIFLLLFGTIIILTEGTVIAPFIYVLFWLSLDDGNLIETDKTNN